MSAVDEHQLLDVADDGEPVRARGGVMAVTIESPARARYRRGSTGAIRRRWRGPCSLRAGCTASAPASSSRPRPTLGPDDAASHARFGATARTSVMFGPAGGQLRLTSATASTRCSTFVAGPAGEAGAGAGARAGAAPRHRGPRPGAARGPGKLTRALGLSRAQDSGGASTATRCSSRAGGGWPRARSRAARASASPTRGRARRGRCGSGSRRSVGVARLARSAPRRMMPPCPR